MSFERHSGVAVIVHESGWVFAAAVYRIEGSTIHSYVVGRATSLKKARTDGSYDVTFQTRPIGISEYGKSITPSFDDRIPHEVWRGNILSWERYYRLGHQIDFDEPEEGKVRGKLSYRQIMNRTREEGQLLIGLPYQFQGLLDLRTDGGLVMSQSFPSNPGVLRSGTYLQYFSKQADQRILRLCTLYSDIDFRWD